jgi:hypothetical protein
VLRISNKQEDLEKKRNDIYISIIHITDRKMSSEYNTVAAVLESTNN